MKPRYHQILEQKMLSKKGRGIFRYVLKYNSRMFSRALCRGINTDVFYPAQELFTVSEEKMFQKMCSGCPIMEGCLEWGLAHERYGIWGGTTPAQRARIRTKIGWVFGEPKIM